MRRSVAISTARPSRMIGSNVGLYKYNTVTPA
jgi:hypothetical protein